MKEYEVTCPYCGKEMRLAQADLAKVLPCPACGNELRFEVEEPASPQVEPPAQVEPPVRTEPPPQREIAMPLGTYPLAGSSSVSSSPPVSQPVPRPPEPPQPPAPSLQPPQLKSAVALPERMKANRLIAGKTCAGCGGVIDLGQDVFNCQNCGQSVHAACHEQLKGCANEQCISYYAATVPPPIPAAQRVERGTCPPDSRPCRFCGEFIKKTARKCRFCDEFQNESDRTRTREQKSDDDNLTGGEIAFGLLCGGVACIAGLIFGLMGKKKGWKMMLLGIASGIVWNVILAVIKGMR